MAEPEPDLPPAVVALQQMLLMVLASARAALDAAEDAVRDPETMRAATQVLGGLAGMVAPLLADFAAFACTAAEPPTAGEPATSAEAATSAGTGLAPDTGHRAA
jgi:hypothetical protein